MEEIECYWFFEGEQIEDSAPIKPLCMDCHRLPQWQRIGWYYKGIPGEWELKCKECKKNINLTTK